MFTCAPHTGENEGPLLGLASRKQHPHSYSSCSPLAPWSLPAALQGDVIMPILQTRWRVLTH